MINLAAIGEDVGSLQLLSELGVPAPVMEYHHFMRTDQLSNGHVRGRGLPWVEWIFYYLTMEQIDALAEFCPNLASADVVIYTRTNRNEDEYKGYSCKLHWDQKESIADPRREKIILKFIDCVEVEVEISA